MYQKEQLSSGMTVITESIPYFRSASIGIWVNCGCMNEPPEYRGLSHFIEHLMFKGTETRSAKEMAVIMDGIGGHLNAFTEKEQTCFYVKVMDRHIPLAMEIVGDMLQNSVFAEEEIEKEKGVIWEEIKMYEDSPDELIFDVFAQAAWDGHPLGLPTVGKKETIESVTREVLLQYVKEHYTPDNIIVAAAGHLKHQSIVDLVEKTFHLNGKKHERKSFPEPVLSPSQVVKFRDGEQVHICVGTSGIPQSDDRKYVLSVLDSILGGSVSSRLFQEIREKRGLVYSVTSFQSAYASSALFGIYAATSKDHMKSVIALILETLKEVRERGVTKQEMTTAKEHIKGALSLALESTSNRMIRLAKSEIYHGRFVSPNEVIRRIQAVSPEEVQALARELFDFARFVGAAVGPVEEGESLW